MILISLSIPTDEHEPFLQKAAKKLSDHLKIDGFRAGHIPYDIVKKEVGAMAILETAVEEMVKKGLLQAIQEHHLETIGKPDVKLKKLVPDNDVEAEILWSRMPNITLPDLEKISIEEKPIVVEEREVNGSLAELQNMRASEAATTEPASAIDRVLVDMDIYVDDVLIEGGSTKKHSIYLSEEGYVSGLKEQLIGLKKDDHKDCEVNMPKDHYSKLLAGKKAIFKVHVLEVYQRTLPELDDAFAKNFGLENLDALKTLLTQNITREKQQKESERATAEMIDAIVNGTVFDEIPDVLIEGEKQRVLAEFKHRLNEQGIELEKYLADIKKTVEELADGFKEQAEKRVKGSLVYRALAKKENVSVSDEEMQQEIEEIKRAYQDNPNIDERITDPDIIDYITVNARNRKVTELLKQRLVKKSV